MSYPHRKEEIVLVRLEWITPEVGGLKGEKIFHKINEASVIFFDVLGIQKINESCEKLRIDFLEALGKDRVHSLQFPKEAVIGELFLPFSLMEPKMIEIQFQETGPDDGHCMDISPRSIQDGIYRLLVYLETFKKQGGDFIWSRGYKRLTSKAGHYFIESLTPFTVKTAAFHEFLHASCESEWFGRKDGIIRPNLIGLNAILGLLEK